MWPGAMHACGLQTLRADRSLCLQGLPLDLTRERQLRRECPAVFGQGRQERAGCFYLQRSPFSQLLIR